MRELDAKIADWRARLDAALPEQEQAVSELETHLRENIDELQATGMTPDAAFSVSIARLGGIDEIVREFRRVQSLWPPRVRAVQVVLALLVLMQGGTIAM